MQAPNLEQDPQSGDDCFDATKSCTLGRIPPYAVAAESESDISLAFAFALSHNLRVAVKSTGHEYQGRSTAKDALLIWMHRLKGIEADPTFSACDDLGQPGPALTTRPGDTWGEAYAVAKGFNGGHTVVGGSAVTVSSCGGYTLGGGHSWQGPAHGMAVDNALQFTAVLADGQAVTASRCSEPDLFYALRGGGGGSFAVLTSCTYALHPYPKEGVTGLSLTVVLLRGAESMVRFLDAWLGYSATFVTNAHNPSGVLAGGYTALSSQGGEGYTGAFSATLVFNGSVAAAQACIAPLAAWADENPLDVAVVSAEFAPYASLLEWHDTFPEPEPTGAPVTLGSRLLPYAALLDDDRRGSLAANLTAIAQYVVVEMFLVAGGAVSAYDEKQSGEVALNPAWRASAMHVVFGASWALNATLTEQAALIGGVSDLTGVLRSALPDSGAYWSESDLLEPDWEASFWGDNVGRLKALKRVVDPNGVFSCWHCLDAPGRSQSRG